MATVIFQRILWPGINTFSHRNVSNNIAPRQRLKDLPA